MGIVNDVVNVRKQLDRLALDSLGRGPGEPRDDLLDRVVAAEKEARRLRSPDLIAVTLLRRAELLLAVNRTSETVSILKEAGKVLGGLRQDDLRVRVLALLAQAYARSEDWGTVSAVCDEGIALVEKYRYKVSADYLASAYLRSRIELYSWGVRSAYELGRYDLMIERAELSKCRSILNSRDDSPASTAEAADGDDFRELCRQISSYPPGQTPENLLARRRLLWDLIAVRRSAKPAPFSLSAVQALLKPCEAILYYYWLDSELLCIAAIERGSFAVELRRISKDDRARLDNYARQILEAGTEITYAVFERARNFASFLLPSKSPFAWHLKERLLISPHRVLHCIPFHAMRYENQWLIERAAISYIANLSSLQISYTPRPKHHVLALGIEQFRVRDHNLKDLPEAETEVEEIEKIYKARGVPVSLLKGEEATADRFRQMDSLGRLKEYSCLHFATHGDNVNSDTPMESRFYLRDFALDGLELASLRLEADTVVLSACSSGQRPISGRGMKEMPGDELFGLQAALFRAGARQILGTLWPVHSPTARKITTSFHAHLANGLQLEPELALQASVREYLSTATSQSCKVYFWAPFFLSVLGRPKSR